MAAARALVPPMAAQLYELPEEDLEIILAAAYPLSLTPGSDGYTALHLLRAAQLHSGLRAAATSVALWQAKQGSASTVARHGLRWQIPHLTTLPPFLRLFAVEYFSRTVRADVDLAELPAPQLIPAYVCGFATAPITFALLQRPGRYRSYCVYNAQTRKCLEHDSLRLQRHEPEDAKLIGTLILHASNSFDADTSLPPGGPQPSPLDIHVTLDELDVERLRIETPSSQEWPSLELKLLIPNAPVECEFGSEVLYDSDDDSADGPPTFRPAPGDIYLEGGPTAAHSVRSALSARVS